MVDTTPPNQQIKDSARFRWSAGSWFGIGLGGSCWMLVGAIFWFLATPMAGWAAFLGFLVCLAAILGLWYARDRLTAYSGLQLLLALIGVISLVIMLIADHQDALPQAQFLGNPIPAYFALLLFPWLMIRFWWVHTHRRHTRPDSQYSCEDEPSRVR